METKDIMGLKLEHTRTDCLYWGSMVLVPIIVACASIVRSSPFWLAAYVLTVLVMQIIIYRFLCTHCPHYCRDESRLHCLFLWNARKIFKKRPGPWHLGDTIMLSLAMMILVLFPVYWLMRDVILLFVYVISLINLTSTLKRYECRRCVYFACPANSVPETVKREFKSSDHGTGESDVPDGIE